MRASCKEHNRGSKIEDRTPRKAILDPRSSIFTSISGASGAARPEGIGNSCNQRHAARGLGGWLPGGLSFANQAPNAGGGDIFFIALARVLEMNFGLVHMPLHHVCDPTVGQPSGNRLAGPEVKW